MLQVRTIVRVLAVAAYFWVGTSVEALGQSTGEHDVPTTGRLLEITKVDVFAKHNWTAKDIGPPPIWLFPIEAAS